MVWILHKLGFVQGIRLIDCWGDDYRTFASKSPTGRRFARVYPFTGVGGVTLHEDGTCSGRSSYIERWMPMK